MEVRNNFYVIFVIVILEKFAICKQKGQSLRSTRPVIGACCKISNNKICYNFGYVHEIAFCTAVPNLSQIGQP